MEEYIHIYIRREKMQNKPKKIKYKRHIPITIFGILVIVMIGAISIIAMRNAKQLKQNISFEEDSLEILEAEELMISSDGEIKTVSEEWIYYQQGKILWKIKVDGSEQSRVLEADTWMSWEYLEGINGKTGNIYYIYNENLFKINLENEIKEKVSDKLFHNIKVVKDYISGENWLGFTNDDSTYVLLINTEGAQELLDLDNDIVKIIKKGDLLIYSTRVKICKYNMANLQRKEMVSYQNHYKRNSNITMLLIDIVDDHMYYSIRGIRDLSRMWGQEILKVNINTLEREGFHYLYSDLNVYGESYIEGDYLYTTYNPTIHTPIIEKTSLKDGQINGPGGYEKIKSEDWIIDQDEDWIYKESYDRIYKLNRKTEQEVVIRTVQLLEWYTDFNSRATNKIGDWIYFNDYKTPPTNDDYNKPGNLVLDNFRINIRTGVEEALSSDQNYYERENKLVGEGEISYVFTEKGIIKFNGDRIDQIATLGERTQKSIIVQVSKEQK